MMIDSATGMNPGERYWLVAASAALLLGGVFIARRHSTNNKPHN
ncbi:hypothetical protein [Pseudomonas sp. S1_E04]